MPARVNGLAVAYVAAGFVLLWSGLKNDTIKGTLTSFAAGQPPAANPTGPLTVSLGQPGPAAGGTPSGGQIPPSSPGAISYGAAEMYWITAGGPSQLAAVMAAIASAESALQPGAVQQGQPYATTGWGLWQITPGNSEPQIGTDKQLLSPLTNARAAVAKYDSQGLGAWTTYTSGAYRQYLR